MTIGGMTKFLFKVLIIVAGVYLLIQMPFYIRFIDSIRTAFNEKMENVGEEVTRVKGKIDYAKEKVDQTKETITNITTKVKDTGDAIEDAFTSINKAHDSVDEMLSGEEGETVPEPQLDGEGEEEVEEAEE